MIVYLASVGKLWAAADYEEVWDDPLAACTFIEITYGLKLRPETDKWFYGDNETHWGQVVTKQVQTETGGWRREDIQRVLEWRRGYARVENRHNSDFEDKDERLVKMLQSLVLPSRNA